MAVVEEYPFKDWWRALNGAPVSLGHKPATRREAFTYYKKNFPFNVSTVLIKEERNDRAKNYL